MSQAWRQTLYRQGSWDNGWISCSFNSATETSDFKAAHFSGWGVQGRGSHTASSTLRSTFLVVYSQRLVSASCCPPVTTEYLFLARLLQRFCNESFASYPNARIVSERYPGLFSKGLICAGWAIIEYFLNNYLIKIKWHSCLQCHQGGQGGPAWETPVVP